MLKTFCTPHDEGRHVYRSLAEFHETDVGLFYRRLSLVLLVIAVLFAFGGMIAWWGRTGEPALFVATVVSLTLLWSDVVKFRSDPTPSLRRHLSVPLESPQRG
jgi:hypothetical protein